MVGSGSLVAEAVAVAGRAAEKALEKKGSAGDVGLDVELRCPRGPKMASRRKLTSLLLSSQLVDALG